MHHIYKDYYPGNIVVPVLKDVNLNVEEGEYLAIMGPSGSGKSTLMNIIGCLDKPTKGDVRLDGLDILNLSENALADVRLNKLTVWISCRTSCPVVRSRELLLQGLW